MLGIGLMMLIILITLSTCGKEIDPPSELQEAAFFPACDRRVIWGDTLRVVKNTISTGTVRTGPYKGKQYWQAMLYSGNYIEPSKFQNTPSTHRVVIADTAKIEYSSLFFISR